MARIFKFNESLSPDDDLLLSNLLNFYCKKYEETGDGNERFYIQASDMVEMGDISQESLDEFCRNKELDKESLVFDPKTKKLKKKKAATKATRTKIKYVETTRSSC